MSRRDGYSASDLLRDLERGPGWAAGTIDLSADPHIIRAWPQLYTSIARFMSTWFRHSPRDEASCLVNWLLAFWCIERGGWRVPINWTHCVAMPREELGSFRRWFDELAVEPDEDFAKGWVWCSANPELVGFSNDSDVDLYQVHRKASLIVVAMVLKADEIGARERRVHDRVVAVERRAFVG